MIHLSKENRWLNREQLGEECINDCTHAGRCDEDVEHWAKRLGFTVEHEAALEYLRGFGAWTLDELQASSDEEMAHRVLWIACGNFKEDENETVFYLGE